MFCCFCLFFFSCILFLYYSLFQLINLVIDSLLQLFILFILLLCYYCFLGLPLTLSIVTTGFVPGDLAVNPEWGYGLLRSLCGWLWHMHLPPTSFHLRWCRSVSWHVVWGSPCGPHMVGGLRCRLPSGRCLQPQLSPSKYFRGPAPGGKG